MSVKRESKLIKRLVVLLQSDSSATENKYITALEEADIKAKNIPTLSFNFVNEQKLQNSLLNSDDYGGMVFTSTRAVSAVSAALNSCTDICVAKWRTKCNFSVGKATAALASSLLNIESSGSDSGNSDSLSQFIIEKYGKCVKPLLFPCSSIRKNTIPDILSKSGISVEEIICYETVSNDQFETLWNNMVLEEGLPEIIIFFSPSGVQFCGKIVTRMYSDIAKPKFVAIGPSTEKALLEAGMTPCKAAEKPNPESVLHAVQDMLDL